MAVTLREIDTFWSEPEDENTPEKTFGVIERILTRGFAPDVPPEVAGPLTHWALAEPGDEAARWAEETVIQLSQEG